MGSAGGTVLVGGHAEVFLHVLAEETKTDEIQLYANLLDTHIRLEEQAFDLLYGQIVDDNLRRLTGDSVADYGQVFRRDSQTVGIPPNLTLTAFVFFTVCVSDCKVSAFLRIVQVLAAKSFPNAIF